MTFAANKLGDRLVKAGYINEDELDVSIEYQKKNGGLIGDAIVKNGFITSYELSNFIYYDQYSQIGEKLIEDKLITIDELKKALEYQNNTGGRLGDICVELKFITAESLSNFIKKYEKKKQQLGEILLNKGIISSTQLKKAVDLQRKSGGKLGEVLLFLGYVDEDTLYRELAIQNEMGRIGQNTSISYHKKLPYDMALEYDAIVTKERESIYIVAVKNKLKENARNNIQRYLEKPIEEVLASNDEMNRLWEELYSKKQSEKSVFNLYDDQPENSAIVTFTPRQVIVIAIMGIIFLFGIVIDWKSCLFILNLICQGLYGIMTILKLYIVLKGGGQKSQIYYSNEELESIDEKELPIYTILVPVYKEKEVICELIKNIQNIDYPQYKLDVCILLEEDDIETIDIIRKINLPSNYTVMIVPLSKPKTKPKACNYGLIRSKGEYLVIYDAEDRPEKEQLKMAYLAFKNLPEDYVCLQAKLNYFNSNQNIMTKWFTQEYSMWFELLLVGIMQINTPIPLGGTSNHFKVNFLKKVGAWDPFNVTEDADLGMRLFKFGYKTAVLDSRTWEEANSQLGNWIRQRSRWIKGYMQTWLVHMRNPIKLYNNLGLKGYIGYHAMILGTPLLPLINPLFWGLMILWCLTSAGWINDLFPGIFYYLAAFQLLVGNFMFTYTNTVGMYYVIKDCALKKKQPFSYGLIKYALLTPIYWMLMSIAAYKALIQLIKNPFYWEKTNHGLVSIDK